ncbi:hypothetical protein EQV77_10685 [Halobacillus fulvus]|nr:hypothetical protein EQV77_10685 [Halobacillus fulvus]
MDVKPTRLSRGVESRKYELINRLKELGYTEDQVGKKTDQMTLTELEQIHLNLMHQLDLI